MWCPTTRCRPSSATPSSRPRTRTSSPTPASTTAPCLECCRRAAGRSLAASGTGDAGFRLRLGHGGSTLTQQLVRGYFLQQPDQPRGCRRAGSPRPGAATPLHGPGRPGHQQAPAEAGGGPPGALARGGDAAALRLARSAPSARSSPATPASSTWATAATASPRAASTTSASRSRATGLRTLARRRCWPGSSSRPETTPPCPETRGRCAAATRSWP